MKQCSSSWIMTFRLLARNIWLKIWHKKRVTKISETSNLIALCWNMVFWILESYYEATLRTIICKKLHRKGAINIVKKVVNIKINRTFTGPHCMQNRFTNSIMFCFSIYFSRANACLFCIKCIQISRWFQFFLEHGGSLFVLGSMEGMDRFLGYLPNHNHCITIIN